MKTPTLCQPPPGYETPPELLARATVFRRSDPALHAWVADGDHERCKWCGVEQACPPPP